MLTVTEAMKNLFPTAAIAIVLGATAAAAQELPSFEASGFPITRHQVEVMGTASVREQAPTPRLTLDGMPASPHQVAVLTPRLRLTEASAAKLATLGSSAR